MNKLLFKLTQYFPWLSKIVFSHDGFDVRKEKIKPDDYFVGVVDKTVLQSDGQWDDCLPIDEVQHGRRIETMACTCFALHNVIEILAKKLWDAEWNKSDRFLSKMAGTTKRGNTLSNVLDHLRKHSGTVNETTWSWDKDKFSWWDYYANIPKNIQELGKAFLNDYEVKYEAIYSNVNSLKNSLHFAPIYCAGYAWYKAGSVYKSIGRANHAFCIYGYEDGQYWKAFDSYEPYKKKLAWDFYIAYPKLVTIKKKNVEYNPLEIQKLLERGLEYIMRVFAGGEVFKLEPDKLVKVDPQEIMDEAIKELVMKKKLVGIDEGVYQKLLI
jgi:hypothetical protein